MVNSLFKIFCFLAFFTAAHATAYAAVFYCTGENLLEIKRHESQEFEPRTFKFDVDSTRIKFGSGGYFDGRELAVQSWDNENRWDVSTGKELIAYRNGDFHYTSIWASFDVIVTHTAKCDKS